MLKAKRHALESGACDGPGSIPDRQRDEVRIPGDELLQTSLACYVVCHVDQVRRSPVGMIGTTDMCHS
jgi:hypothetical protein